MKSVRGAFLNISSEFPDCSVHVFDFTNLVEIVDCIQGWCEELTLMGNGVRNSHIEVIGHLRSLKSLTIGLSELDDEALLRISELGTLCKLKFISLNKWEDFRSRLGFNWSGSASLIFSSFPSNLTLSASYDYNSEQQLKQELQRLLPRAIIK